MTSNKKSVSKLRGQPSSMSMPSFRFNVGDDDLEEIEPETKEVENNHLSLDGSFNQLKEGKLSSKDRSVSLDVSNSPAGFVESDSKSLLSGIKETVRDKISKTAKNLEEKMGIEIPASNVLSRIVNEKSFDETNSSSLEASPLSSSNRRTLTELKVNSPLLEEDDAQLQKSSHVNSAGRDDVKEKCTIHLSTSTPKPSVDQSKTYFRDTYDVTSVALSSLSKRVLVDDDEDYEISEEWEVVDSPNKVQSKDASQKEESIQEILNVSPLKLSYWRKYLDQLDEYKNRILLSVLVAVCCIIPMPSFLSGFIVGAILMYMLGSFLQWRILGHRKVPEDNISPFNMGYFSSHYEPGEDNQKVWMNELTNEYSPETYHINQTRSVFLRLSGNSLRISWPQNGIPKRAMWNEIRHEHTFVSQRYVDLTSAQVLLKPEGLVRKRLWSKKYPICLVLNEASNKGISESSEEKVIYLFTRTSREKETWYRKFLEASMANSHSKLKHRHSSSDSCHSIKNGPHSNFHEYILELCSTDSDSLKSTPSDKFTKPVTFDDKFFTVPTLPSSPTELLSFDASWVNAFIARSLWDVMTEESWSKCIADKIQKKLSKIKVPYFIEELTLTEIELGSSLPTISKVTRPYGNDRGLWTHFDISYTGSFCMTLETKLNLMRLKKPNLSSDGSSEDSKESFDLEDSTLTREERSASIRAQLYDSDAEDSAESSSEDESLGYVDSISDDSGKNFLGKAQSKYRKHVKPILAKHLNKTPLCSSTQSAAMGGSTSKKLLRIVDKIAQSKYFQQATDIQFVKKKMEEVSNTRLLLTVEMHSLTGTLAINIPPPPTDRLWYGFHGNPKLWISARPKLGERQVTMTHITDWIEKKLAIEFQRVLVLPNMDDLIIPVMEAKLNKS